MTNELSMLDQLATMTTKMNLPSVRHQRALLRCIKAEVLFLALVIQRREASSFKHEAPPNLNGTCACILCIVGVIFCRRIFLLCCLSAVIVSFSMLCARNAELMHDVILIFWVQKLARRVNEPGVDSLVVCWMWTVARCTIHHARWMPPIITTPILICHPPSVFLTHDDVIRHWNPTALGSV